MTHDPAPALTRGLQLLAHLERDGACSLEQLSRATRWPKSSVSRLLCCLESSGMIQRDLQTKHYRALMRLVPLDSGESRLRRVSGSALASLCAQLDLTVELHRFNGTALEMIDRCEPENSPVQVRARLGWKRPLDEADALTQTVLAFGAPSPEWDKIRFTAWHAGKLVRVPAATLETWVKEARERALAWDAEPNPNGVRRYAAPLQDHALRLCGVLAVAHTSPTTLAPEKKIVDVLRQTAHRISQALCAGTPLAGQKIDP